MTAWAISSLPYLSEPNVPSPMAGMAAPVASVFFGTRSGSTPSAAGANGRPVPAEVIDVVIIMLPNP